MSDTFTQVMTDLEHIANHSSDRGTDLHALVARIKALTTTTPVTHATLAPVAVTEIPHG